MIPDGLPNDQSCPDFLCEIISINTLPGKTDTKKQIEVKEADSMRIRNNFLVRIKNSGVFYQVFS